MEISKKEELGIYVHIPFCKSKCSYCDFISFSNKQDFIEKYISELLKEIDSFSFDKYDVTTIYIGGGTPSFIDEKYIEDILKKICKKIEKENFNTLEVTIEVNPSSITEEKLEKYREIGINRISIGCQTTNNEMLKKIGRIHSFETFVEKFNKIKQYGFNTNVDLMIALPDEKLCDVKNDLENIIKLEPNHISVYSLILEENTPFSKMKLNLPSEDDERKMYHLTKSMLEQEGYYQYEISNFSKKGFESKHNLNCWSQKQYIGFGLNASSYINGVRFKNTDNLDTYLTQNKKEIQELQDTVEKMKEYMMLGFRKTSGININEFRAKFNFSPLYIFEEEIKRLEDENLIIQEQNFLKLTSLGLDLANLVFEEFI